MSYNIEATGYFKSQLKRLVKKYPSLKSEMSHLLESLEVNPKQGSPLGRECYKIRLAVGSKGKGKSGGDMSIFFGKRFTCFPFMINQNRQIFHHH